MYVKIDGQLKAIKGSELTTVSATILLHYETETGKEGVFKRLFVSPKYYHLRKLLSSEIDVPSDIVCGNKDFII